MEDNSHDTPTRTRTPPTGYAGTLQHGEHNAYNKFLASLTPEEYEAHCRKKGIKFNSTLTARKTVQELWNSAINENSGTWNTMLQSAAMSVLQRAIERGDPVAFNSITDRILGKVATNMTVNVKESDTEQDILKQIQSIALNSVEKQLEKDEENIVKNALKYADEHTEQQDEKKNDAKTKD